MATRKAGSQKSGNHPSHAHWMARAIALARRGLGRTSPNPPVGAVIVKNGRMVGEGWTRPAGGPHAEVVALRQAGRRAQGATLYVTLEPCAHYGRTPPCAGAVIAGGIAHVVVGVGDPNPRVRGRGLRALAAAGVTVTKGVLSEEAGAVSAWFRHYIVRERPYVILKLAASIDGRIATARGESRWISGPAARRWVHELRNQVDAVMVGSGTAVADDPALTCRIRGGRDPLRVVVDGGLRLSPRSRLVTQRSAAPTLLATTASAAPARVRALVRAGAEVLVVPGSRGKVALEPLLRQLAARGVVSVMIEGGAGLGAAALRARVVDRLLVVTAPLLIGGDGRPMLESIGLDRLAGAPRIVHPRTTRLGPDLVLDGTVAY